MPDRIQDACEACFAAHANDCSGFARAVASQLGVTLSGLANEMVDTIGNDRAWMVLDDGIAAAQSAAAGKLVIGGLRGDEQAHRCQDDGHRQRERKGDAKADRKRSHASARSR